MTKLALILALVVPPPTAFAQTAGQMRIGSPPGGKPQLRPPDPPTAHATVQDQVSHPVFCCAPSVQQVLDRYVQATGGRDALLRHQSMTIHGRTQVPARGIDVETVTYMKGTKALTRIVLPNGKALVSGYDGTIAWSIDTAGVVHLPKGDVIRTIARDADMYYHLHVMRYFKSMAVIDIKDFNGRPCYHLKGVNNWGKVNEQFYDTATGLLQGYAFNTAWRGGKGDAITTFDDYESFGGVLMPAATTNRDGDDVSIDRITSVTYDDVPDSMFIAPSRNVR